MNLSNLFAGHRTRKNNRKSRPRRLRVEGLEDRRMCALPGMPARGKGRSTCSRDSTCRSTSTDVLRVRLPDL